MSQKVKAKPKAKKPFPSDFVLEDIASYTPKDTIKIVNEYLDLADGSELSEIAKMEIIRLFSEYPFIVKLMCCAYEHNGYNSF